MPFRPGESGNPGGRPKGLSNAIRKKYGDDGARLIAELDKLAFGKLKCSHKVRLDAIKELFDRGWGKSSQEIVGDPARPLVQLVTFGGRYRPNGAKS